MWGTDQPDVIPGRVVCIEWKEEGHQGTREMERSARRERERERLRVKRIRERERKLEREEDEKSVDGLSPAPLSRERERERVDGGGIYARVLQSCVAHRSVCHCVRYN